MHGAISATRAIENKVHWVGGRVWTGFARGSWAKYFSALTNFVEREEVDFARNVASFLPPKIEKKKKKLRAAAAFF